MEDFSSCVRRLSREAVGGLGRRGFSLSEQGRAEVWHPEMKAWNTRSLFSRLKEMAVPSPPPRSI